MDNIQSIAALGIVFLTMIIFLVKILRKKKNSNSCSSSCHCDVKNLANKD